MKPSDGSLQCWITQQTPLSTSGVAKKLETRKDEPKAAEQLKGQEARYSSERVDFGSIVKSADDNPSLSDMDNGNGKEPSPPPGKEPSASPRSKPVFTQLPETKNSPPNSGTQAGTAAGLSLLQIYMRQRSQTSMERERSKKPEEVIASGGGEGWVEDYPSSADEKLGLGSISSSLADEDADDDDDDSESQSEEDEDDEDDEDDFQNNRSLTLTDVSDIEQTSIQIDAVPFNSNAAASSLDKLIAKIKPFELGLSPASIEEHWNFESRMRRSGPAPRGQLDKSCQAVINPATSATQEESTLTDPVKPQAFVIFPSYSLPDLSFLKKHDYTWIGDVLLSPQTLPGQLPRKPDPPVKQKTFDDLKRREMSHVKDWESLKILLPEEIRHQINSIKPAAPNRPQRPRPKSCDNNVVMREKKTVRPAPYRGSVTEAPAGYALATVPQSPTEAAPPPLPKRTASLPHGNQTSARPTFQRRPVPAIDPAAGRSPGVVRRGAPVSADPSSKCIKGPFGYTMRKTVSFGEHLSGGFLKMANQKRPLSLSHWSGGGSFDIEDREGEENAVSVNMEQKKGKCR